MLRLSDREVRFGDRTWVMGVLNATPDSFSGDGLAGDPAAALSLAETYRDAGVDLLDIGGESTRPGAAPVSVDEEAGRVVPVIQALRGLGLPLSIDTRHSQVAAAALDAGAQLVNDVSGLTADPQMAALVAARGVPVIIQHTRGTPQTMGGLAVYDDVVAEVMVELEWRLAAAAADGIARQQIILDPGIGFAKTTAHNLELLRRLPELRRLGCPLLVGTSRKRFIGEVLGLDVSDRLEGTAATVALAIAGGADLVRVHDVKAMVRVARMADAVVRGWQP